MAQLREEIADSAYTSFMDTPRGYSAVQEHKTLAKVLDKMQAQWNVTEDKVQCGGTIKKD